MRSPNILAIGMTILILIPGGALTAEGQFRKGLTQTVSEVMLNRKRPPKVLIIGTNLKVEVVSQADRGSDYAQRFQTAFETQLLANDSRLKTGGAQPDTIISCTITRLESTQTAGSRQVSVSRQVGTKRVCNAKNNTCTDEPNYQLVQETQSYTTIRGDMAVSVQVRDRKSGATLDSQSFTPSHNQEVSAGITPPDRDQVAQWLITAAVRSAVERLTPTREPVKVLLARPNDPIDDLNALGQAGLWARMLEQLELMKPLSDPKKEAYRLYNIGVASEAVAYDTDDTGTSKKLLERASGLYGQALEMKPDERYFREPQTRISQGLAAYAEIERQQMLIAEAEANAAKTVAAAATSGSTPTGARDLASPAPTASFSNRDVIDLVGAGLDEANLLSAIKDAKEVAFDLSPAGLKELLVGKVSNRIIVAMRAKQSPPTPATGPARRPTPAAGAVPRSAAPPPAGPAKPAVKPAGGNTAPAKQP